jgi:methionyl-tRNA formyltransferase
MAGDPRRRGFLAVRVAFLGTPPFAVPALDALVRTGHELVSVVAQPDRPAGRGQVLHEPATKAYAREKGLRVLQPEKVRDGRLASDLRALSPDVLIVVAYGRILGADLLEVAPLGAVNVHASLLPRWRGAAPIQWSLASGDVETGVTLMRVAAGLDQGDILVQRSVPIGPEETGQELADRLAVLGAEAVVEGLPLFAAGRLTPVRQDDSQATEARILTKEDGRLDFSLTALEVAARLRAFTPWPGVFTVLRGRLLKVHAARPCPPGDLAPGEVRVVAEGLVVGCAGGSALLLLELQQEGRRRLAAAEFVKGLALPKGTVLGR